MHQKVHSCCDYCPDHLKLKNILQSCWTIFILLLEKMRKFMCKWLLVSSSSSAVQVIRSRFFVSRKLFMTCAKFLVHSWNISLKNLVNSVETKYNQVVVKKESRGELVCLKLHCYRWSIEALIWCSKIFFRGARMARRLIQVTLIITVE